MRWLTWIGITALSSANFIGCADGGADTSAATGPGSGGNGAQGGGGESTGPVGGGGAGATGGGGGAGGVGGGPIGGLTYTGTILDGFSQMPIDAVSVCALEPMLPCVPTNATGSFVYPGVPENSRVRVGASKDPYFPIEALVDTTDMDGTLNAFMLTEGLISIAINSLMDGFTFDPTKPAISVLVKNSANVPQAGYSLSLSPDTGEGPYYASAAGDSIDKNLTSTSTSGVAFYVNNDLGDHTLTVSGPATCVASFVTEPDNQHTAPLINPAQFVIVFDCE